jgi:HJR/Mrr/RecB family endonuclease
MDTKVADNSIDDKVHRLQSELLSAARRAAWRFRTDPHDMLSRWYLYLKGNQRFSIESLQFEDEKFVSYAYKRMYWLALDDYRRSSVLSNRRVEEIDFDNLLSYKPELTDVEDRYAVFDIFHLTKSLSTKHPKWADLVELRFVQGFSYAQTAVTMGKTKYWVMKNSELVNQWIREEYFSKGLWLNAEVTEKPEVRLVTFTKPLYEKILKDPSVLYSLSSEDFERMLADRFTAMGFEVAQVGQTNRKDGGVDLVAWPRLSTPFPFLLAVQAKHHYKATTKTRVGEVRDFYGVLSSRDSTFHLGVLVTSTTFTADAKWFAEKNENLLRLRDLADLTRWMRDDFGNVFDWREIPSSIVIARDIHIEIPKPKIWTP